MSLRHKISFEAGDRGKVGIGNYVNVFFAFNRPSTTEASDGKNPVSHVLSHEIAFRIYQEVRGIREVIVWLCSQIGKPIDKLLIAAAQLILECKVLLGDVYDFVVAVIGRELDRIQSFTHRLDPGELAVC